MEKAPIDAVVFDYGNVLSRPQDQNDIERLTKLTRLPVGDFGRRYAERRLAYDRGLITGAEYWADLLGGTEGLLTTELAAELIRVDVASWLQLDNRVVAWARKLRTANISLAILSNMPLDVLAGLRKSRGDWLGEFAVTIFSCEVGCVKPEAQIYRRLLDALALTASRVLLIDDRQANVQAATQSGLQAVRYCSFEALQEEVQDRFDLPLPIDTVTIS
jgi:putative hydrolase of the HAD superfamily